MSECVNYLSKDEDIIIDQVPFSYDSTSCQVDIDEFCDRVWEVSLKGKAHWINHSCGIKGCAEAFSIVDGNEKLHRTICSAPREKTIRLNKCMPKVVLLSKESGYWWQA